MTNKRLLLAGSAVALALAPTGAWAAQGSDPPRPESGSGGALAVPLIQGPGGGVLAPEASDLGEAQAAQAGEAPEALGGQEPTPIAPGGEQQPGSEPQVEANAGPRKESVDSAEVEGSSDVAGAAAGSDGGDALPTTGLGLTALAAVGLGFVLAGLGLRR
jgi:hypothetical protein